MKVTLRDEAPESAKAVPAGEGVVKDAKGRSLTLRELTLLQEQDLIASMDPAHAANQITLGRALVAARVAAIDGVAVDLPVSNRLYRAMLQQVGREGMAAVLAATLGPEDGEESGENRDTELAKN